MIFKFFSLFLALNLIQIVRAADPGIGMLRDYPELSFYLGQKSYDSYDQLNCVNDQFSLNNYDTRLCDTYASRIKKVVCTNIIRSNSPRDYVCKADLDSSISFNTTQIQCLENDRVRGVYFIRTCVLNYTLVKNKQGWFKRHLWFIIGGIAAVLVVVLGAVGYSFYGRTHERVRQSDL